MKYTTSDIEDTGRFAAALQQACADIMNGMPKSQACEKNGISLSMMNTVMKGLHRIKESDSGQDTGDSVHLVPWQDRLAVDLGASSGTYLPDDFEEALDRVSDTFLSKDEKAVLQLYYKENMTLGMIAERLGISGTTVRDRRNKAIRILRRHRDEIISGVAYEEGRDTLNRERTQHEQAIQWMTEAIDWLQQTGSDENIPIEKTEISDEAKAFYRNNGFVTIADVINVSLSRLFVDVTNAADDTGVFLSISADKGISPDTPLTDTTLKPKTVSILEFNGLHTIRDVIRLSPESALQIPHIRPYEILQIYRLVLFGEP